MQKTVSVRFGEEDIDWISLFATERNKDKSEVIREIFKEGRIMHAILEYETGKVSITKAAEIAGKSLSEFIDILVERGIRTNIELEDVVQGYKNLIALIQ